MKPRFTVMTGLGGVEDYPAIATTAEQSGWTSMAIPDSLFYPEVTESEYPYMSTEAVRQVLDGVPVLEPLTAIASLVGITETLQFYPAVLKVPVRQPLVLAKILSSLAVMSNNRVLLGAGLSPWKEDFIYNGVDFDSRGKLMDECITIIRAAMSGEYVEHHSEHYDFGRLKLSPVPEQPVPVLIGGHAKPALRRAARLGDGWVSANTDYDTLAGLIATLNELREEHGTFDRPDFQVHAYDVTARSLDDYRRLADLGVTDICLTPWNPMDPALTRQQKLDGLKLFGEHVISAF
jgi:alkanesulfonate monooxygenase SsuD/methylene tetrahydromethanopterin reductase-like flavin-dependent oxidoreductase (luciferase family)